MDKLQSMQQLLTKRGFQAEILPDARQATARVLELIQPGASVGFGGSVTVQDMGLYPALKDRGNPVHWHWMEQDKPAAIARAAGADWYLCSSNALTQDGWFVNIDGNGNRVAALAHGPAKLLLIIGSNKLCGDYDDAMARIKAVACPQNARRLGLQTPCGVTGKCTDCSSKQRFCNYIGILQRPTGSREVRVLLLEEELGY